MHSVSYILRLNSFNPETLLFDPKILILRRMGADHIDSVCLVEGQAIPGFTVDCRQASVGGGGELYIGLEEEGKVYMASDSKGANSGLPQ